jgi:hypothetical protein
MLVYVGYAIVMRMAMTAITTSNSMKVKPPANRDLSSIGLTDVKLMILTGRMIGSEKELRTRKMLDNTVYSSCM